MILLIVFAVVLLRLFYSIAEIYYERDWPARTWSGLAVSLVLLIFIGIVFA
jgi:hypothetical protein